MSVPSREFMIQQAVLNAALPYAEKQGSLSALHRLGMPTYLDGLTLGNYVRDTFCDQVRKEYRLLAQRFEVAA